MHMRPQNMSGVLTLAAALAWPLPCFADAATPPSDTSIETPPTFNTHNFHDHQLLSHMHIMNIHVIRLSQLAQKQAALPSVRHFAEHMILEHYTLEQALLNVAAQHDFIPGSLIVEMDETPNLRQEHRNIMTRLGKLIGPAFDRAYLESMVKIHEEERSYLEARLPYVRETDIKQYFDSMRFMFQKHLFEAQQLLEQI